MRRCALLLTVLTGCAWQQRVDALRTTAAGQLNCEAGSLQVFTRDGLGRVKGCQKEGLYVLEGEAWQLESMYPTNAKGVAFVPRCGSPEVIHFESAVEDVGPPMATKYRPPVKISGRPVRYPKSAAMQNIKGAITATCDLASVGLLVCCDMDEERAVLDDEIRTTLATWRFDPARRDGRDVASRIEVPFTFELY